MSQNYPNILATDTLQNSLGPLLQRDDANASNNSGTAFPTASLVIGMFCYRTDQKIIYQLKDLIPTWVEIMDLNGTTGLTPRATLLDTARTFSLTGPVTATGVTFNGSGNVALATALANSGVTAGTYCKVTVDAAGRVTVGAAIANSDLPNPLSVSVIRAPSANQVSLASTGHGMQVGLDAGTNFAMSLNSLQVRSNGVASAMFLQQFGGSMNIGDGASNLNFNVASVSGVGLATLAEAQDLASPVNIKISTPSRVKSHVDARQYVSGNQIITSAGTLTLAHGLTLEPKLVQMFLVCITDEAGYTAGDVVAVGISSGDLTANASQSITVDATSIVLRYASSTSAFRVAHATTGVSTALTNGSWRLRMKAMV